MSGRGRLLTLLIVLAFGGFLLWSTLSSQRVECTVAVEFQGQRGEATASAASEADAVREAQITACGPLTGSMDDRIACSHVPPVKRGCRVL